MNVEMQVMKVFHEVIGVGMDADKASLIYNEFPGWDSVAHMALVAGLETEFDCMLEMEDILDMSDFGKATEIMGKYV